MRARNLVTPLPTVHAGSPATDAAAILARHEVRAILVVDEAGAFVGVVSDSELLRALLPPYVDEAGILAHVLDERASEVLFHLLEGKSVRDLMPRDRDGEPLVRGDDTLVEVASVMVRAHASAVGVLEDDRLIGGITIDDLLTHLLARR